MIKADHIRKNWNEFTEQMQRRKWNFVKAGSGNGLSTKGVDIKSLAQNWVHSNNVNNSTLQYNGKNYTIKLANPKLHQLNLSQLSTFNAPQLNSALMQQHLQSLQQATQSKPKLAKNYNSISTAITESIKLIQGKEQEIKQFIECDKNLGLLMSVMVYIMENRLSEGNIMIDDQDDNLTQSSICILKEIQNIGLTIQQYLDATLAMKNNCSKAFGLIKSLQISNENEVIDFFQATSSQFNDFDKNIFYIIDDFKNLILQTVPNFLSNNVINVEASLGPKTEDGNLIFEASNHPLGQQWFSNIPAKKTFNFQPLEHQELGEGLDCMHFERAANLTGSRFLISSGDFSRLQRALINFMLEYNITNGFTEVNVPYIVNENSAYSSGQLPKFAADLFKLQGDRGFYLIPTAEIALVSMFKNMILQTERLPINLTTYSECFRSEAGSAGQDTKGMIRQHQFGKVELVSICKPEESQLMHNKILQQAEGILQQLGLHYQTCLLCPDDTGFGSHQTYDIEVWLPGQGKYREISSCSNMSNFQASRANIRAKSGKAKTEVHTLNGSGLAVGRTLVAILENYQQENGDIEIPQVLQKYFGDQKIITKANKILFN